MRCAVLGDPVGHSLSPALHRAAYAELGLDWTYDAVRVPAGGLAAYLDGLGPQWRGLSLTMPLKREVMELLTAQDSWSRMCGAANTVLLEPGGARHGLNTDVPGALTALREATDVPLRRAVVLGGGATAASVLLALAELGLERATLAVREPSRVAETLAAVARHPRPPELAVTSLQSLADVPADADVVVSTIPASAQVPGLVAALAGVPVVFEVRYDPWPTPLAAAAAADGRTLVGGLDLLLWQAVDQVRAMTGCAEVPVAAMRRAAAQALAAQSG